jgi:OPA family sugar phosphate sensor protein UhpC-like MFS transporter
VRALVQPILRFFAERPPAPRIADPDRVARLYRRWRVSAFLSITLGYALFYTTRLTFSVAKKPMLDEGILSAREMGKIGFVLLLSYAVGKLVNGFLADRVNPARFFATGLLVSALVNLAFGAASGFAVFAGLWAVNGWVQSLGGPTSGTVLSAWFTARERGTRYSVWSVSHNIGEGITFAGTALLVDAVGWRGGFVGPGLVCAVAALVLYRTMGDRPVAMGLPPVEEQLESAHRPDPDEQRSVWALQLEVLKNIPVWVLGMSSALMYVARYAVTNWGVLYLQTERGYSLTEAGMDVSIVPIVGIVGTVFAGTVSDRWFGSRRSPVTLAYGLLLVVSMLFVYLTPPGHPWVVRVAMGGVGLAIGGLLVFLGGLTAMDICSRRASGAALGLVGFLSYLGAAIQDWVSGGLVEAGKVPLVTVIWRDVELHLGDETWFRASIRTIGRIDVYDFDVVRWFWIGAAVLSVGLALTLWRTETRRPRG